jgi:lipopolysaccharide transport system ATP-binding protein
MYVRLAFAVAAHLEPEILIVDEVLAVGDAAFQKKCIAKMNDVAHHGRTVLFVSHNLATISSLCTRAVLLNAGRVSHNGKTAEVVKHYQLAGAEGGELVRQTSPYLIWRGISNRDQLSRASLKLPLCLKLLFETHSQALDSVNVDIAIYNKHNIEVVHARSPLVSRDMSFAANSMFEITYSIDQCYLAPGPYRLTVYVYSGPEVLLWIDNIDAFDLLGDDHSLSPVVLGTLRGVTTPEYSVAATML